MGAYAVSSHATAERSAIVAINQMAAVPGTRPWVSEADPGRIMIFLEVRTLPPPMIVNLRNDDDDDHTAFARDNDRLNETELDYFQRRGGNIRWYRASDRGHLDADGFLTIVDRYSRFAKIAGEMISLSRIEDAVRGVIPEPATELVAVNVPDDKKGERVVLLVDETADLDTLRDAIDASDLHKLTKPSEIHPIAAIPRLGSGKLDLAGAKQYAIEAVSA